MNLQTIMPLGTPVYFPETKLDAALKRSSVVARAKNYSSQVHLGEQRKITGTNFFEDHICFVAGSYAERFPNNDLGIACAFLHDAVENAEKLVERIEAGLGATGDAISAEDFLNQYAPPLFLEFIGKNYNGDISNAFGASFAQLGPEDKVRALHAIMPVHGSHEPANSAHRQRMKRDFRDFMTDKIFEDFGNDADQVVYILTRHKRHEFVHVHKRHSESQLNHFFRAYKKFNAEFSQLQDFDAFIKKNLAEGHVLRQYLEEKKGFNASDERAARGIMDSLAHAGGGDLSYLFKDFWNFAARKAIIHPNVLKGAEFEKMRLGVILANDENIDHIYATGFTDGRNHLLKPLLPIAANIKCLDIIHNLCTLDYKSLAHVKHARNVLRRTDYLMPYLEQAGAERELLALAHIALGRANTNLFRATQEEITKNAKPYEAMKPRVLDPKGRYGWLADAINQGTGTRLTP